MSTQIVAGDAAPFGPEDLLVVPGDAAAETPEAPSPADAVQAAPPAPEAPPPKVDPPDPRITEMDRNAFMRHMLGSARFTKEYVLKNGAARVKLQSRTVAENDDIYDVMAQDIASGRVAASMTSLDYVMRLYRYFLSASLVSFTVDVTANAATVGVTVDKAVYKPEGKTVQERHAWLAANLNEAQFRLLLRCQEEFEYLQGALFKEAISEDFTGGRASVS